MSGGGGGSGDGQVNGAGEGTEVVGLHALVDGQVDTQLEATLAGDRGRQSTGW